MEVSVQAFVEDRKQQYKLEYTQFLEMLGVANLTMSVEIKWETKRDFNFPATQMTAQLNLEKEFRRIKTVFAFEVGMFQHLGNKPKYQRLEMGVVAFTTHKSRVELTSRLQTVGTLF